MKPGPLRFEFFLNQLQPIVITAGRQKNPALWLYRNNARTPLFMLEGLTRVYGDLHNGKRFDKLQEHFKAVEDGLGAIDYYDMIAKDLGNVKKVPAQVISYLQAQSREKLQSVNEILSERGWLLASGDRISKIRRKLQKADWLDEKAELDGINEFYGETIYNIAGFEQELKGKFTNMEDQVHELRRRLRWLSIYPQALRGAIQLVEKKPNRNLSKYLTKEIVSSAFNQMPAAADLEYVLQFDQNSFYSISWMIAALGSIKDSGLRIVAVKEALQQGAAISEADAFPQIYRMLGKRQPTMEDLLKQAAEICTPFFKEQNLEHLVLGVSRRSK
jgi:hypothetical protein